MLVLYGTIIQMREQLLQKEKQCAQMSIDQQVLEHAKLVAERDKLQAGRCILAGLSVPPTRQCFREWDCVPMLTLTV